MNFRGMILYLAISFVWVSTTGGLSVLHAQDTTGVTFDTHTVSIELKTPNPGWSITINSIYRVDDRLWVFSELSSSSGMTAAVISSASDTVSARLPNLPVTHYVSGKDWNWDNDEENVRFIGFWNYLGTTLATWTRGGLLWKRDSQETT